MNSYKNLRLRNGKCCHSWNMSYNMLYYIVSQHLDILALTETWLGSAIDDGVLRDLIPVGYNIYHKNRNNRRGGGIALLFKEGIDITDLTNSDCQLNQFEHMKFSLRSGDVLFRLCVIYIPPPSTSNGLRNTAFLNEWELYLIKLPLYRRSY